MLHNNQKKMKILFLLVTIFSISIHANADLIADTCLKTPNPTLCEQILRASPKSPTASVAGLGLIMLGEVKLETEDILCTLSRLIEREPPESILIPTYKQCTFLYDFIIKNNLVSAVFALQRMEPGDPRYADQAISDAVDKFNTCENGLKGKPPSPIGAKDKYARELTVIALSIIKVLEGS